MMHRVVNMTPKGLHTDHINGNKLDNRESNLRSCNNTENSRSRTRATTPKSGFIGVCRKNQKWQASIMSDYRKTYIGVFDTPELAARAYDDAARRLHGSFAKLNFSDE
jgi:hypothetical protein